jgi:hypothetical protein
MRQRRKIGIVELLSGEAVTGMTNRLYHSLFRRQFHGVMAQTVAVWCRRLGHEVTYATYYGQKRPDLLVPEDCDLVFVSAFTEASALSYALAKLFRRRGARTVLGGPHARAFPEDARRFFDLVVVDCDEATIGDIAAGVFDPGTLVSNNNRGFVIPQLEERFQDVCKASDYFGRRSPISVVPLLSSTGCPYACDFCVDWNNDFRARATCDLSADLSFAAEKFPGQLIAFYDPNFGVNFDKTLAAFEQVSPRTRNPYIIESSLSILKAQRLSRLRDTNCVYIAPGVESWADYANKSGTGRSRGHEKLEKVVGHFELIAQYVPGLQANFLFGTDADQSYEPVELTKRFIERFPNVFPGLAIPLAFGGTPLRESLKSQRRLVDLSPIFYFNPVLTARPKNYDPITFYKLLIELFEATASPAMLKRRMTAKVPWKIKLSFVLRTMDLAAYLHDLRQFAQLLQNDRSFLDFHEGKAGGIPDYYQHRLDRRLGVFSGLLSGKERQHYLA